MFLENDAADLIGIGSPLKAPFRGLPIKSIELSQFLHS